MCKFEPVIVRVNARKYSLNASLQSLAEQTNAIMVGSKYP